MDTTPASILIVDDEASITEFVSYAMQKEGYRTEVASNGEEALEKIENGGGDRSQTIAGLRQALPKLKEEGYSFVTVQELLDRYPYQGEQQS